jgi:hypothetical protein
MKRLIPEVTLKRVNELLRRDLARAGETPFRPRQTVAVVQCGAEIDTSPRPYYDAVMCTVPDLSGAVGLDGASAVVLADINGEELTPDQYYVAWPGAIADGVQVWWADVLGSGGGLVADYQIGTVGTPSLVTSDTTWTNVTTTGFVAPAAKKYRLTTRVTGSLFGSTAGAYMMVAWYNSTTGSPASMYPETISVLGMIYATAVQTFNTIEITFDTPLLAASDHLKLAAWRSAGTWTVAGVYGSQLGSTGIGGASANLFTYYTELP